MRSFVQTNERITFVEIHFDNQLIFDAFISVYDLLYITMHVDFEPYFPYETYNPHQKEFLTVVGENVANPDKKALMLSAPTGSGKTSVVEPLLAYALNNHKKIVVVMRTVSQLTIFMRELELVRAKLESQGLKTFNFINIPGKANLCTNCEANRDKSSLYRTCKMKCKSTKKLVEELIKSEGAKPETIYSNYDSYYATLEATRKNNVKRLEDARKNRDEACKNNDEELKNIYEEIINSLENRTVTIEGTYPACPEYLHAYIDQDFIDDRRKFLDTTCYNPKVQLAIKNIINHNLSVPELIRACGNGVCPYEVILQAAAMCDVIIMNVNHVMNLGIRDAIYSKLNLNAEDVILIFDEAHNLPNIVTDMHSSTITPYILKSASNNLGKLYDSYDHIHDKGISLSEVKAELGRLYNFRIPETVDIPMIKTDAMDEFGNPIYKIPMSICLDSAYDTVVSLLKNINNTVVGGNFDTLNNDLQRRFLMDSKSYYIPGTKKTYDIYNLGDSEYEQYMETKLSHIVGKDESGSAIDYSNVLTSIENVDVCKTANNTDFVINKNDFWFTIRGRILAVAIMHKYFDISNNEKGTNNLNSVLRTLMLFYINPDSRKDNIGKRNISPIVSVYTYNNSMMRELKYDDKTGAIENEDIMNLIKFTAENPKTNHKLCIEKNMQWKLVTKNVDPSSYLCEVVRSHAFSLFMSGTIEPVDLHAKLFFGGNFGDPKDSASKISVYSVPSNFKPENREVYLLNDITTISKVDIQCKNKYGKVVSYNDVRSERINGIIQKMVDSADVNTMIAFTSYKQMYDWLSAYVSQGKLVYKDDKMYLNGRRLFVETSMVNAADLRVKLNYNIKINNPKNPLHSLYSMICSAEDHCANNIHEFMKLPERNESAVLFAIQRGKYSEGIDFRGDSLKRILVIGLPLSAYDTMQQATINYYKAIYGREDGVYISYSLPAQDGMLQTAGRVLRSVTDTGTIVYADFRVLKSYDIPQEYRRYCYSSIGKYMPSGFFNDVKIVSTEQFMDRKMKF